MDWLCRGAQFDLGSKTHVMGILNTTPDSFSDGGEYFEKQTAIAHALRMAEDGADIIDIGGESTRPGADPVDAREEIRRTVDIVAEVKSQTACLVSIDTMKSETAQAALEAGADIVNDVSAGTYDEQMMEVVADYGAGVVLMHMLGSPRTMQRNPEYGDVVENVYAYLSQRMNCFMDAGVDSERIVVDPGIGFGKTVEHNLELLRHIARFADLQRPVLVGASRKSFLGKLLNLETNERKTASLGIAGYCAEAGVNIIRAHDVKDTCQITRLIDILKSG